MRSAVRLVEREPGTFTVHLECGCTPWQYPAMYAAPQVGDKVDCTSCDYKRRLACNS